MNKYQIISCYKSIFLFLLILSVNSNSLAQKFPFDIPTLASPSQVNSKQPIRYLDENIYSNEQSYIFSNPIKLQGVYFKNAILNFKNFKLIKMTFPVQEKSDFTAIIDGLAAKYKKEKNCSYETPYCYRAGNLIIYLLKSTYASKVLTNYGWLYYEYEPMDSF